MLVGVSVLFGSGKLAIPWTLLQYLLVLYQRAYIPMRRFFLLAQNRTLHLRNICIHQINIVYDYASLPGILGITYWFHQSNKIPIGVSMIVLLLSIFRGFVVICWILHNIEDGGICAIHSTLYFLAFLG